MRLYNYSTLGGLDAYGQAQLKENVGQIKMTINTTSTAIQDNINYKNSSYIGLTMDKSINDTYVIEYGKEQLKVLYVIPKGKYTQVFMTNK